MELRRKGDRLSRRRGGGGGGGGGGGFNVRGKQQRGRGRKTRRLSPHFCATQFIWIKNPLFTPNSRILKTLRGAHPTQFLFSTSQLMYSKCYRHTGMHPPSPSLHCSVLSVFKKEGVHTHSRERACMFARDQSLPARCPTRGRWRRHNASVRHPTHSRPPRPLRLNTDMSSSHLDRPN